MWVRNGILFISYRFLLKWHTDRNSFFLRCFGPTENPYWSNVFQRFFLGKKDIVHASCWTSECNGCILISSFTLMYRKAGGELWAIVKFNFCSKRKDFSESDVRFVCERPGSWSCCWYCFCFLWARNWLHLKSYG